MVKLGGKKIKLGGGKKKGNSENNNNAPSASTPSTSTTTSSANNARAEYYSTRNNVNTTTTPAKKKSANASNPFGDDDDDDDSDDNDNDNGGAAATTNNPFGARRRASAAVPTRPNTGGGNKAASNPFGDDDDDSDSEDDALAGFGKRKPPSSAPSGVGGGGGGGNNPFDSPIKPKGRKKKSNPFGDDDDDDDSDSDGNKGSSNTNNNPFGETPPPPSGRTKRKTLMNNGQTDPFASEMRAKGPPQLTANGAGIGKAASSSVARRGSSARGAPPPPPPRRAGGVTAADSTKNPFGVESSTDEPPVVPKPLISQQPSSKQQQQVPPTRNGQQKSNFAASSSSSNPYSDSAPPAPKKRWGMGVSRNQQPSDTDSTRPLMSAMDEQTVTSNFTTAQSNLDKIHSSSTNQSGNAAGLKNWLRLNKKEDDSGGNNSGSNTVGNSGIGGVGGRMNMGRRASVENNTNQQFNSAAARATAANGKQQPNNNHHQKKVRKKKCRAYVTPWPFDNYHEVQEQMYEELASRAASDYNNSIMENNDSTNGSGGGGGGGGWDEKKDEHRSMMPGGGGIADDAKYYERPDELSSIKEAVNDLALVDFEKKAEERAINIVSTWLFDAGLIDELLVNGAMIGGGTEQAQQQHHQTNQPQNNSSSNATVNSTKTSEGQEMGANGFPVSADGAEVKMDKETNKLRAMIARDLSIINARLNDGVAASGLEVQELVNAVSSTQDDIGRLRELTTYISSADQMVNDRDEFLLAKYPYLRKAINARRNIHRCFRELDFFAHIPSTCERLRDDLHSGEWTSEEWDTIRNVSMEHVELEVMLVEAEAGMKGSTSHNYSDEVVDSFLETHVQNVWELGDEIRMRIIAGIGSAFDLSINNPAGMVALVESVEVYERAAEMFETKKSVDGGGEDDRLHFTNMRAAALEQLYQDFEMRGMDMFREVHENAAETAEEDDASNTQFTAILKAATELVTEIDIIKHQMSPCFASHWHVETLWSSCIAHVCSNHIVQQIGGPDGQNLPELTITQLLELVAWVEYFREMIEETFPEVASMRDTKKTYFEDRPDLFEGEGRTVNTQNATESLAYVNNMLWEVHRLAQEEFLVRTRSQTDELLDKVYGSETVKNQSSDGKLTTSLCEDVFSFMTVQLRTVQERLSKTSDALILAVCIILSHMRSKQIHARNPFLQDLETCCAASNDFTRMSEKCEDMISELMAKCEFSEDMVATVEATSNELMGVYSSDAVYAARSVHIYVFDPIDEEIGVRLFEQEWEETMVDNDLAISLVRTLEDFHEDLEQYMDDFMVVKSMLSLMSATVIFYIKCLLQRAETHKNNKRPFFGDVQAALDRMTGDIKVMKEYFEGLVSQMPSLKRNIEGDFEILSTIHELMSIAAGFSVSDAEDFILMLQKRVRDVGVTKHIVGDLWHLVAPTEERYVWELVESMEEQLCMIAPTDDALAQGVNDRSYVRGLRLDEMAVKLYIKSRRNRPIKATAVESIVKSWKKNWIEDEE